MSVLEIRQSAEDYLETILILTERKGTLRSIDVVHELGFSKPSVSHAMKGLRENGCILMDEDGYITLTKKGRTIAQSVYERHTFLVKNLMRIGVSEAVAKEDACRIEHVISAETFDKLKAFAAKFPD